MTAQYTFSPAPWILCLLVLIACTSHAEPTASSTKNFTVLCAIPEDHESFIPTRYAYQKALTSLGYQLNWQVVSPARTFHNMTHGNGDAVCLSTPLTLKFFDTGVGKPLKTVLGSSKVFGWSIQDGITINEQALNASNNLRIGYLKNFTGDFLLQSHGFTQGIAVNDVSMAAKMLISRRIDVMILIETESFEETLSYWLERQQQGSSQRLHSDVVSEVFYSPYVHDRHEALRKPLERALSKVINAQGGPISRETIAQWKRTTQGITTD